VDLADLESMSFQPDCIGCLPDSNLGVSVDVDLLVTHNTAILGILGVGKTYLAFELIRRVLLANKKVVVLDITGQYATEFRDVFSETTEDGIVAAIADRIAPTVGTIATNVADGGNIREFHRAVRDSIHDFISDPERRIYVINPGAFEATRQEGKKFAGEAPLAVLTIAEATRVFSEELFSEISGELRTEARVLLVLEEAHSLVPEWNSTSYDGDQRASNGTAKAILQGRKYGLGVLLVTQRTANVTKTILNQCNTVFAFRTFDATGMDYLSNYVGDTYAQILSGLADRTVVLFGRASSCDNPVILNVNRHDDVVGGIWEPELPRLISSTEEFDSAVNEEGSAGSGSSAPEEGGEPEERS
jgi:DNA helicase HerA-like ATPase